MSSPLHVYIRQILEHVDASPKVPSKRYADDAGWDLYASRKTYVPAKSKIDVHTDIAIAIPSGWYAQIKTRSSTMDRTGLMVLEGVIDHQYRGELFFMVYNPKDEDVYIAPGERLAQILFLPVPEIQWIPASELPRSERGSQGFGSTGW